jgi:hypothetical protein
VQSGEQRPAGGVDDDVGGRGHRPDVGDGAARAAHVDALARDLGVADQQRRGIGQASTGTSAIAAAISASGSS